jgi:hypothetical protein
VYNFINWYTDIFSLRLFCEIILISFKCFLLNQLLEDNVDNDPFTRSDDHLTSAKMEAESNFGPSAVPNSAEDSNLK